MKIALIETGKQYEVLREKADYYVYLLNGNEQRIYKKVEGEVFVIVGKEYSWGTVADRQDTSIHPRSASVFPPIEVKINYEDSETMEKRLKEFSHK